MVLFVTILQLLCGLAVILAVLFQSGKSAGLSGAIGGMADTFMAKGKAVILSVAGRGSRSDSMNWSHSPSGTILSS